MLVQVNMPKHSISDLQFFFVYSYAWPRDQPRNSILDYFSRHVRHPSPFSGQEEHSLQLSYPIFLRVNLQISQAYPCTPPNSSFFSFQLTRQSSVAYLASFLARASFVDPSLVSTAVQSLLDWAGQYLDQYADASIATPVQALGTPSSKVRGLCCVSLG